MNETIGIVTLYSKIHSLAWQKGGCYGEKVF
jgi:hypothetical protein